ncbi:MAG: helix-turn-helix domain-containing protein [bacterium]
MANKKKHLRKEERFCIEKMLGQNKSFGEVARTLGRGISTISEEVNANGGRTRYDAQKAHHRAYLKQWRKKRGCRALATPAQKVFASMLVRDTDWRDTCSGSATITRVARREVVTYSCMTPHANP